MSTINVDPAKLRRIADSVVTVLLTEAKRTAQGAKVAEQDRELFGLSAPENLPVREAMGMTLAGLARAINKNPDLILQFAELEPLLAP